VVVGGGLLSENGQGHAVSGPIKPSAEIEMLTLGFDVFLYF